MYPSQRIIPKGNVAAVEPYIHHMPQQKSNAVSVKKQQQQQQQSHNLHAQHHQKLVQDLANLKMSFHETANQKTLSNNSNANVNIDHVQYAESDENKLARQLLHIKQHSQEYDANVSADITDFVSSSNKSDSKFQTLPYGTAKMISKNYVPANMSTATTPLKTNCSTSSRESMDSDTTTTSPMHTNDGDVDHQPHQHHQSQSKQSQIGVMNKSAGQTMSSSISNANHQRNERDKSMPKSKLATATHQIPSGNLVVPPRKPISSVAPTSITSTQKSTIPSLRVHAVAPSIITQTILSTVESTTNDKSGRPALPPKPNKSSSDSNSNSSTNSSSNSSSSIETSPTLNATMTNNNRYRNASTSATAVAKSLLNASDKHTSTIESNVSNNQQQQQSIIPVPVQNIDYFPIKAKPLTIKKQPLSEQPRLRSLTSGIKPIQYTSRRIEMPSSLLFPDIDKQMKTKTDTNNQIISSSPAILDSKLQSPSTSSNSSIDDSDKSASSSVSSDIEKVNENKAQQQNGEIPRRQRSSLSDNTKVKLARRVSFDPLALLLDASLEGELELVQKTAMQVRPKKCLMRF